MHPPVPELAFVSLVSLSSIFVAHLPNPKSSPNQGNLDERLVQGSRARSTRDSASMIPLPPNSTHLHPSPLSTSPTPIAAGSSEAEPVACTSTRPPHQQTQLIQVLQIPLFYSRPCNPAPPPWLGHNHNTLTMIHKLSPLDYSQYCCPGRPPLNSFPPIPTPSPPPPPPPPPWLLPSLSTLGTALAISLAALSSPPAESYTFPSNQLIHPVWNLLSLWL